MRTDIVEPALSTLDRSSSLLAAASSRPRPFWRGIAPVALAVFLLEMALASRYGLHRDELYFIECGRHLAWGYVDQPPLVPAIARLVTSIFGISPLALRSLPAVAGAISVATTALTARELGGGRTAQFIAALGAGCSLEFLATFHLLAPTSLDAFFWSIVIFLVSRLCRSGDPRLWLAIGITGGLGLMAKLNMGFLLAGIVVAFVATGRVKILMNRWAVSGLVSAAAIFSPDLLWNAQHQWAQLSMLQSLKHENSTLGASIKFVPAQFAMTGLLLAPVWISGLWALWRHATAKPLAVTYVLLLAWFAFAGAKPYYLEGAYFALFAAGGLAVERRPTSPAPERYGVWYLAPLANIALALPLTLPVLPLSAQPHSPWLGNINKDLSATIGWPQFAHQIADIADELPTSARRHLVILTGDYGAASAVDLYGAELGLPSAISGHNNFWWWGPGTAGNASTTIAVNMPRELLRSMFTSVTLVGSVATPHDVWTEERGDSIWICRGQAETWQTFWPTLRHYG